MSTRGRFISFEGIEGVGKSTQIDVFADVLSSAGLDVLVTREPGGTVNAEKIRAILKEHTEEVMPASAELLLMFAARAINVANTIGPALDNGTWVIADRFTDSTRAYQGAGRGLSMRDINRVAELAHGATHPELTVLLDAPTDVGLARAGKRGEADRFETEEQAFFERVREGYLALARAEPERIVLVDASRDQNAVSNSVRDIASNMIKRHLNNEQQATDL